MENNKSATIEKYRDTYGDGFFFSDTSQSGTDCHKIIVMTAKQRSELRDFADDKHKIFSIEESEGQEIEISGQYANVYTRPNSDIKYLADQLGKRDKFRGLSSPVNAQWTAVAVHHDFEGLIPLELGWVLSSDITIKSSDPEVKSNGLLNLQTAAKELIGLPYYLGGKSPMLGYDCSGFTQTVIYRTRGLMLPRLSKWQALVGKPVNQESLVTGDLMFFREKDMPISHVGIVIEPTNGLPIIIDCSVRNKGVAIEDLNNATWLGDKIQIAGYRRI